MQLCVLYLTSCLKLCESFLQIPVMLQTSLLEEGMLVCHHNSASNGTKYVNEVIKFNVADGLKTSS